MGKNHNDQEPEKDSAPITTSEVEALRREMAEWRESQRRAEEENAILRSQVREAQRQIELLHQSGQDIDFVALDARWRNREEARRRIYDKIRGKKITIHFHADRDPNRNYPVHVNLNGKFINIPRGKAVEIDGDFLEVIDHAMVNHIAREVGEDGNPKNVVYDFFSYPYTITSGLEGCSSEDRSIAQAA